MKQHGVIFQPSLSGTLSLSRTNAFFLCGGKALVNAYYNTAQQLGVAVAYEANVLHVKIEDGLFQQVDVQWQGEQLAVRGRAVVLASGGFQADPGWVARAWGAGS